MDYATPGMLVGGKLIEPDSSDRIPVINPATEKVIGQVADGNATDVDRAVSAARDAFTGSGWAKMSFSDRAARLFALAEAYDRHGEQLSKEGTDQNGMAINTSRWVSSFGPGTIYKHFASIADQFESEETRLAHDGTTTLIRKEPYGPVGLIVPWNGPHLLLAFKLAPALLAGNTAVFKSAPETSLDLALFAQAIEESGFPPGVINFVTGGRETGDLLVRHPGIVKVGFTGSTDAGRKVAEVCGRDLKPVTLELGGKSAAILLEDADLDQFVADIPASGIPGAGQACYATTRILAPRGRYDEIVQAVADGMTNISVGNPLDENTVFGPLVAERQRERVENYIEIGKKEGAKLVVGGGRPKDLGVGYYVEPTVFSDVDNRMTIAQEEIFGPVLAIIPYDSEQDAIAIANDSTYGLGGSVYTADHARGVDVARQIETGSIGVNRYGVDYNSPYGGYKDSGLGRELGPEAVAGFSQTKVMYI